MNHTLKTGTGNNGGKATWPAPTISGALPRPDGEGWTVESIAWRAHYVGPVLEKILAEMEGHWKLNEAVEI